LLKRWGNGGGRGAGGRRGDVEGGGKILVRWVWKWGREGTGLIEHHW